MSVSTPFCQLIAPAARGQIAYRIAICSIADGDGSREVVGRRLSPHFAATRYQDWLWRITHLPSGLAVPGAWVRTLREAKALALTLEGITDFSQRRIAKKHVAAVRAAVMPYVMARHLYEGGE